MNGRMARWVGGLLAAAVLGLAGPALAQYGIYVPDPGVPAALSVTTSTSRALLAGSGATTVLTNTGSVNARCKFGDSSVTAATTDSVLLANSQRAFGTAGTYVACVTASGSTSVVAETGSGVAAFGGGGGSGGGGGGASTVADGADVAQGSTTDAACASSVTACTLEQRIAKLEAAAEDGAVADLAADSGTSLKIGGKCATAQPAITTAANRVPQLFDCLGKPVVLPYALPASYVSGLTAAMTGTTSTAVTGIGAPGAGLFNYLTTAVCGNSHATVGTFVEFQDGSGGTTFFTIPAAAVYGGAAFNFPTPLKQPTANTALYVKDTTTGANVICSVAGYKAP